MKPFRLAILDLYNGEPNQGMRCIQEIVSQFEREFECSVFDIRGKGDVPGTDYDVYISSGGPGDPLEGDGDWDRRYFQLIDDLLHFNQASSDQKKHVFFICHSFQMACHHFGVAKVTERHKMSFGTFRTHMTEEGRRDPIFNGLPDPFYVADFRSYQVVQPNWEQIESMGANILALEKIRPHVPLERAIMAMRFTPEMVGTQFHPEADPDGMLDHFLDKERRVKIIEEHSEERYLRMIEHLNDPDKIQLTHDLVLPLFLMRAIRRLHEQAALIS